MPRLYPHGPRCWEQFTSPHRNSSKRSPVPLLTGRTPEQLLHTRGIFLPAETLNRRQMDKPAQPPLHSLQPTLPATCSQNHPALPCNAKPSIVPRLQQLLFSCPDTSSLLQNGESWFECHETGILSYLERKDSAVAGRDPSVGLCSTSTQEALDTILTDCPPSPLSLPSPFVCSPR